MKIVRLTRFSNELCALRMLVWMIGWRFDCLAASRKCVVILFGHCDYACCILKKNLLGYRLFTGA